MRLPQIPGLVHVSLFLAVVTGAFLVIPVPSSSRAPRIQAAVQYSVTDLGTLGGTRSSAAAINKKGQVVGWAETAAQTRHAFLWSQGKMQDLGTLGGVDSQAHGLNDKGEVVGGSVTADNGSHAFLWSRGKMQDLGSIGYGCSGTAVNDKGEVVGYLWVAWLTVHAFLYSHGEMRDIGTLGGSDAWAAAINNQGQVTGWSCTHEDESPHAFRYRGREMEDLGTLGGTESEAVGIDDRGRIAGSSRTGERGSWKHAFVWEKGSMKDVGTLMGGGCTVTGVNDRGDMVGTEIAPDRTVHYFVRIGDVMSDIALDPYPGLTLTSLNDINNRDEIAATGRIGTDVHALLLKPHAPHIRSVSLLSELLAGAV